MTEKKIKIGILGGTGHIGRNLIYYFSLNLFTFCTMIIDYLSTVGNFNDIMLAKVKHILVQIYNIVKIGNQNLTLTVTCAN